MIQASNDDCGDSNLVGIIFFFFFFSLKNFCNDDELFSFDFL